MAKKKYNIDKPIAKRNLSSDYMFEYIKKNGTEEELKEFCIKAFDDNNKFALAEARDYFAKKYPDMIIKEEKKKKAKTTIDIMREIREKALAE